MKWLIATLLSLLAGCTTPSAADPISHIHSIAFSDEGILLATHNGVVVIHDDWSYETRPGPDLMSMARASDGTLYAGGHPAQVTIDGPKHLGLATSMDGGRSWQSISMEGEVDLHAMTVIDGAVWTYWGEALQQWDGSWTSYTAPSVLLSLATVDGRLFAGTPDGAMMRTDDGWEPLGTLAPVTSISGNADVLYAATSWGADGAGYRTLDAGMTWQPMAQFSSAPYSLHFATDPADPHRAVAGTFDGRVYETLDAGASWTQRI